MSYEECRRISKLEEENGWESPCVIMVESSGEHRGSSVQNFYVYQSSFLIIGQFDLYIPHYSWHTYLFK